MRLWQALFVLILDTCVSNIDAVGGARESVGLEAAKRICGTRQHRESVGPDNTVGPDNAKNLWGQIIQKSSGARQHRKPVGSGNTENRKRVRISGSRQHRNRWGWAAERPGNRENSNRMGRQYWLVKEFRTSALREKPQRDSFNTLTAREISEGGRVN